MAQLSLCVTGTSARHQQHTSHLVSHRHALVPGRMSMKETASQCSHVLWLPRPGRLPTTETYCSQFWRQNNSTPTPVGTLLPLPAPAGCTCTAAVPGWQLCYSKLASIVTWPSPCKDTSHIDQGLTWVKYHFILNDSYIGNDPVFQTRSRPEVLGLGASMCLLSEGDTVHP